MNTDKARPGVGPRMLFMWAIARVILPIGLVYGLREPLLAWIEARFDIIGITLFAIDVLSTPLSRSLIAIGLCLVIVSALVIGDRSGRPLVSYMLATGAMILLAGAAALATGTPLWYMLLPIVLLGTNLAWSRVSLWHHFQKSRLYDPYMRYGVLLAEALSFRAYVHWLVRQGRPGRESAQPSVPAGMDIPAVALCATLATILLSGKGLLGVEQRLRMPLHSSVVLSGDFNWISMDSDRGRLLVTGHGIERIAAYRIGRWEQPESVASVDTGSAQAFWHDAVTDEVYVYNSRNSSVLILDAASLLLKRTIPVSGLSPGDPWIVAHHGTDTIAIVSEADVSLGKPFVLIELSTGRVLQTGDFDPGNMLLHPGKSLIYMSYFRRRNGIFAFDLTARSVAMEARADARIDRMAFWKGGNELLVASPARGRVLRYDADTLHPKGAFDASLGVRVLAVDESRGLLVGGSLTSGKVDLIDLGSGDRLGSHFLGPWLRTISLDENAGVAYVSSNGFLYSLEYDKVGG